MPKGETKLWTRLRGAALGHRFRRQHVVGPYVVDFVCLERRVIVEVDGFQHSAETDAFRQGHLERRGYRVLRFWSLDVLESTPQVVKEISAVLDGVDLPGESVEVGGELIAREHEYPW